MKIYIPVEVKTRELNAKLFLSCFLANAGFEVFLGRKHEIQRLCDFSKPGIFLAPGAFKNLKVFFERIKSRGFIIAVNEEEGLVTYTPQMYKDMRLDYDVMKVIDLFISWGKDNLKTLKNYTNELNLHLISEGNPRVDLLRKDMRNIFDEEVKNIKKKYGQFILITTSFGAVNHFNKEIDYLNEMKNKKTLTNHKAEANFLRYFKIKKKTLYAFIDAIKYLANKYQNQTFIIRPHPSESEEIYNKLAAEFKNIFVSKNLGIHPWIIASQAVIHHYCTTAVEAAILDKITLGYRPFPDQESENHFPFSISEVSHNLEELEQNIIKSKNNDFKRNKNFDEILKNHISNLDGSFSSQRISNSLYLLHKENFKKKMTFYDLISLKSYVRLKFIKSRINKYIDSKFNDLKVFETLEIIKNLGFENDKFDVSMPYKKIIKIRKFEKTN
jgi:surface carbohydrate biosynthesis protein